MKFVNISGKAFNTIGPSDYSAFEYVNRTIQDEPSDALDAYTLGVFASIGIEKGKPFTPDAHQKKLLTDGAALLIDAEDAGSVGRGYVKADDIAYLVDEQWIVRQLERLATVRLQAERHPHPADRGVGKARFRRH
jgi:hypothetical protein